MQIHIGHIIEQVVRQQGRSIKWLAEQLCCDRTNIYDIFRRSSIDTQMLLRISIVLNHDFFEYYQQRLLKDSQQNVEYNSTGNES